MSGTGRSSLSAERVGQALGVSTGMQPKALPEAGNGEEARAPGIGATAC